MICIRCHPFLYLCILITILTLTNVIYITKMANKEFGSHNKIDYRRYELKLISTDEHTILSRIRYPDRSVVLLHGSNRKEGIHILQPPKLTIGIASMSRKINTTQDYLMITLNKLFKYLNVDDNHLSEL